MSTNVSLGRGPWPDVVWSAPVLRGLDERARVDLELAGDLHDHAAGERVYSVGEPADALCVVVSGAFSLSAIRRGDREPTSLRVIEPGGSFAEEALLRSGGARPMEASCARAGTIACLPAHVLRRVAERAGGAPILERLMRSVRRSATKDALRAAGFERELTPPDFEAVLDASSHVDLRRGDALYRAGDVATHAYVVGDGMVQLQSEEDGCLQVRAYLTRGDLVGAFEAPSGRRRELGVAASGATWLVAIPRDAFARMAHAAPRAIDALSRVRIARHAAEQAMVAGFHTTQHVFKDLYRVSVARSLLVIDQDHCVRCGHCSWSCADVHADGVSRLLRRGDKIVSASEGVGASSLLLPNSCQHCQSPACMIDCPTGAIGRDPHGEVTIREDLCIGCASCAKACPWDNIQMAPRGGVFGGILSVARAGSRGATEVRGESADVAVKCDLCASLEGGPACVAACPTEAIARIQPGDLVPELLSMHSLPAAGPAPILPRPEPAAPWFAGALCCAVAMIAVGGPQTATGAVAGVLTLGLAAYALPKRSRRVRLAILRLVPPVVPTAGGRERRSAVGARSMVTFHVAAGLVATGAAFAHAGARLPANGAGALVLAFWATAAAGLLGAIAYRLVPARLSRIERGGALPEDLGARRREVDERIFATLSGRSELVKALYARILRPYARTWFGPAILVASGRTLRKEEDDLRGRIERTLEGRGEGKLDGLSDLVRLVVERRALAAQRALSMALRAWHPVHVIGTALVLGLLALHVVVELVYR